VRFCRSALANKVPDEGTFQVHWRSCWACEGVISGSRMHAVHRSCLLVGVTYGLLSPSKRLLWNGRKQRTRLCVQRDDGNAHFYRMVTV